LAVWQINEADFFENVLVLQFGETRLETGVEDGASHANGRSPGFLCALRGGQAFEPFEDRFRIAVCALDEGRRERVSGLQPDAVLIRLAERIHGDSEDESIGARERDRYSIKRVEPGLNHPSRLVGPLVRPKLNWQRERREQNHERDSAHEVASINSWDHRTTLSELDGERGTIWGIYHEAPGHTASVRR
jgi:hypothetical protein